MDADPAELLLDVGRGGAGGSAEAGSGSGAAITDGGNYSVEPPQEGDRDDAGGDGGDRGSGEFVTDMANV